MLSPTDYNALAFFKACSIKSYCATDDNEYYSVVARLGSRPEVSSELPVLMRSTYVAEAMRDSAAASEILRSSPIRGSHHFAGLQLLVKWQLQSGDLPGALHTRRQLYAIDEHDLQLTVIRRMTALMQALP